MTSSTASITQIPSGIPGLDELLRGGFIQNRMYLISGGPGTGKTTIGLHWLAEGLENGETVLFIHGEESATEIIEKAPRGFISQRA